jgi:hypothetical protein
MLFIQELLAAVFISSEVDLIGKNGLFGAFLLYFKPF